MASKPNKTLIYLLLLPYSPTIFAVTFTPALQIGEYYSDNVFLTAQKQSDWITEITPSLTIEEKTAKSQLSMVYQLQVLDSRQQPQQDRTFHQGSLKFDTKQDRIAFDVASQYTQDIVNPIAGISPNNLVGQQRPDVLTTTAMPTVSLPIGHFADADLSWRYGQVNYQGTNIAATHDNRQTANLQSGRMFQDVQWSWLSSNQESKQNGLRVSHLQKTQFNTFVTITSKVRGIVSIGNERNQGSQLDSVSGSSWSVGFQLTPSRHSQLQAQIGHRPFGTSYVLNALWQRKKMTFSAVYDESVTTDAQARLDTLPKSILPVSTNRLVQFFPQVTNQLFINRSLKLAWDYTYKKSIFTAEAFRDRREYIAFPINENGKGYNLSWVYKINPHLQSRIGYGNANQDFLNGTSNPWSQETASLDWLVGPQVTMQLTAQHFRSKPSFLDPAIENSVSINLIYKPDL
jgi:uncharacterized protein (PEP-CTERM system associated)